ncbi:MULTISPECIES: caspase family protein [unclassified Leptolyngbya]|uniref:caspase family protein n=1 Tax=unclassified Leptolyngbya TaxID=2650499 RepID=UPI0016894860|nr:MULTISPECIES: caspase family protein [unclassified Leptolyngbya]MBD1911562.1 caspase family protein [Leptolyngbya sp. FACHB-8]MBD2155596.1 caspase family protein [Leptolyngbya sp. FACHB-16]
MVNYWAIAIGINQYENFQPLTYAERDAQAMQHVWAMEGGIPIEQCFLLSDNATPDGSSQPAPNRDTILDLLTDVCQHRLCPDDVLWLFFSGYGAQYQNKDYLLPMDAEPTRIPATAIAVEDLFGILQAAPTRNILTLLDMNRSQGTLGGEGAGAQTLELAQHLQLPVILSCRPEQFSHETLLLRQGLFTSVLLEGLRSYGCLTPEQLAQFLRNRLPELSEHHWRPRQDPAVVIPDQQRYQLLLPGKSRPSEAHSSADEDGVLQSPEPPVAPLPPPPPPDMGNGTAPSEEQVPVEDEKTWQKLLLFGGLTLLALLALVVVRNGEIVTRPTTTRPSPGTQETLPPSPSVPLGESGTEAAPQPSPTDSGTPSPTVQPEPIPAAPQNPELPPVGSGGDDSSGKNDLAATDRDRQILDSARATLTRFRSDAPTNQVSEIGEAIRQLRQIPPGNPVYAEAQQSLDRWSAMIFDIAIGRAARQNGGDSVIAAQNYQAAISAAQLVPSDRPETYRAAMRSITVWSQKTMDLANLNASQGALGLAIQVANYVPPNTPAYAEAQRAIATWQAQVQPLPGTQQTAEVPPQ